MLLHGLVHELKNMLIGKVSGSRRGLRGAYRWLLGQVVEVGGEMHLLLDNWRAAFQTLAWNRLAEQRRLPA